MYANYFLVILAVLPTVRFVAGEFKLQILHTNDMHSRYDEVDESAGPCSSANAKENKCYGGFARVKMLADQKKEEARKNNISSLFLNAGDTFDGSPLYSYFKWQVAAAFINALGLDAMCLGNHEFDDGIQNLVQYLENVTVPVVTVNLNRSTEEKLNEKLVKNSIVLDVNGHKIGIIGYLTSSTTMLSKTENLKIFDEIPYVRKEAQDLKSKGVNLIIGLGHSGFDRDKEIAAEVEELDLIIGGHTHSLLYTPKDQPPSKEVVEESYPYWVTQKSGKRVPIVQSSAYTKYFGILTLTLDNNYKIVSAEGNSHLLNYTYEKDPAIENKTKEWTAALKRVQQTPLDTVVGHTRVPLSRSNFSKNGFESNFGNLITDAIFYQGILQTKANNLSQWTKYAAAFYPNGSIRKLDTQGKQGNLTEGDILAAVPYNNTMHQCQISGKEIKEVLELSVTLFKPTERRLRYFLHFSGLRVVYDLRRSPADRVANVTILCTQCSVPRYETLKTNETYYVIVNGYLLGGGDSFTTFKQCGDVTNFDTTDSYAVLDYIKRQQIIYPILDGRIEVIEADS